MSSKNPSYALIITDTSIKNDVAISITHIYTCNRLVVCIVTILSKPDIISCMSTEDITSIGVQKKT